MKISDEIVELFKDALVIPPGVKTVDPKQMARIVCHSFHRFLLLKNGGGLTKYPELFPRIHRDMSLREAVIAIVEEAYKERDKAIAFDSGYADEIEINKHLTSEMDINLVADGKKVAGALSNVLFILANHPDMDDSMVGFEVLSRAADAIAGGISYTIKPGSSTPGDPQSYATRTVRPTDRDYIRTAVEVAYERTAPDFPGHL